MYHITTLLGNPMNVLDYTSKNITTTFILNLILPELFYTFQSILCKMLYFFSKIQVFWISAYFKLLDSYNKCRLILALHT